VFFKFFLLNINYCRKDNSISILKNNKYAAMTCIMGGVNGVPL